MNEPIKNDLIYFRNEILKDMKEMETKLNDKIVNLYSLINKINSKSDEKLSAINIKIKTLQDNDPSIIETKINSVIERNNNNLEQKISDLSTKIFILQKDLTNACYKYDKIVIDNLKVTGLIGDGCPYMNLKYFIEFLNKKITELITTKEKLVIEIKTFKNKINDMNNQIKTEIENQKIFINEITSNRINESNKKCLERSHKLEERIDNLRLENYNFSNDLIKKTEELKIQWDKLENIKEEIYDKLNEEKISFKKYTDNLSKSFNSQKKEFTNIKNKFNDKSNIFKQLPYRRNSINITNIGTRLGDKDISKISNKKSLSKKYFFNKDELSLINKDEIHILKEDKINENINEIDKEENVNNIKEILSENSEKKQNIIENEKENEKENELNVEINNINKNNRKNNKMNDNNLNDNENKNIYTRITIKSLNKKSKDEEKINDEINIIKEKNDIIKENNNQKEELKQFQKTLNKNIFLNLKGNKSLQKFIFNNSLEKKHSKKIANISQINFWNNNIKKKILKLENEKILEPLSLSNDLRTINNTSPFNLKIKNLSNKSQLKNLEDLLHLNINDSLSNLNSSDKENKFYKKIVQYIKIINHNIDKKLNNFSSKIAHDIISIKKSVNQIYNDINLCQLNSDNNKRIKKITPFYIKINNYDLYNDSGIQLNMENFKNTFKHGMIRNKSNDKIFNSENLESPKNILNNVEPFLIKKFKDKGF